jgi:hypothetical protein
MAITTPANLAVLGEQDFALASMPSALDTILKNTNYLYQFHRPAMLSVAYCSAYQITGRTARFTIPVKPSVDGLLYEFRSKLLASSAGAWTLTTTIETYDAVNGWQVLTTAVTVPGIMADQLTVDTQTGVLPAAVTMIRVSYTGSGASQITPHHLLVTPTPIAPVTGIKASGFVPYDDGFLSTTGAVTTEHVNRAHLSATKVLQDRAQCAFAFVQEDTPANMFTRPGLAAFMLWRNSPAVKVGLFGQYGELTLDCAILAGVTRGTGKVRLSQHDADVGGAYFEADADGVLHTGTLPAVASAGGPDSTISLSMGVKLTDPLAVADIYAIVAWWRPTA